MNRVLRRPLSAEPRIGESASALPERVLRGEPGADLNLLASFERYWSHRRDDDDETRNTKT